MFDFLGVSKETISVKKQPQAIVVLLAIKQATLDDTTRKQALKIAEKMADKAITSETKDQTALTQIISHSWRATWAMQKSPRGIPLRDIADTALRDLIRVSAL